MSRVRYEVANRSAHPRRFGGVWVMPGESAAVDMRPIPERLVRRWFRAGVSVRELTDGAVASPSSVASLAPIKRSPFDRDGDGSYGGSMPAEQLREDMTAVELAEKAERRAISYQTLRRAATRFISPVPRRTDSIIRKLRAL